MAPKVPFLEKFNTRFLDDSKGVLENDFSEEEKRILLHFKKEIFRKFAQNILKWCFWCQFGPLE